ncbi:pyrroline-5-carboxylate reductase [Sphingomonas donggukensis]|uniref:Pyrroline-5-carboxylate reductase n=1 Tax=Sphingomonas donggukensis TaxID=2949093 RepID=A0ABY4TXC7_9SPHN|nr:pyrroline-5-carboxylate reductase dimerization domain-containing protein [Sphingomonas donggukensis]URW77002.1 pyrroline-5-carboxylate reductase [Sphingomonas donggukensis]
MGGAMLARWIADGADPANIVAIDPGAPDVPAGVTLVAAPPEGRPDVLVLAIKPQLLDAVAPSLASTNPDVLVSILAGVEEATLAAKIPARAVVRAMPNLPVAIGRGVVALHTTSDDARVRDVAEALMAPLGLVEWIADEALFHAVVALSGSGPGFAYRFIEAMAAGAAALGLPAAMAERFAIATVEGAAALAADSDVGPAVLADRVASPGGTTRAGLDVLDHGAAMRRLVADTLTAAARRSAELAEAAR